MGKRNLSKPNRPGTRRGAFVHARYRWLVLQRMFRRHRNQELVAQCRMAAKLASSAMSAVDFSVIVSSNDRYLAHGTSLPELYATPTSRWRERLKWLAPWAVLVIGYALILAAVVLYVMA